MLLEKKLEGEECSVLAFCDGENALILPPARDFKRLHADEGAPLTGGMGAYAPVPGLGNAFLEQVRQEVFLPVLRGMAARGVPYHGILYAGLMLTAEGPAVLEFNVRWGDPEAQVILPLLSVNIMDLILGSLETGGLRNVPPLTTKRMAAVCVNLVPEGYPGCYQTGVPIRGIGISTPRLMFFQGGTEIENGVLVSTQGRTLSVVGTGRTLKTARAQAYQGAARVQFDGKTFRPDIAKDR